MTTDNQPAAPPQWNYQCDCDHLGSEHRTEPPYECSFEDCDCGAFRHLRIAAAPAQPVPASQDVSNEASPGVTTGVAVNFGAPVPAAQPPTRLTDEEYARELSMDQIEEIFQSWRKQIEKDRTAFLLWTNLLEDLRMAARKVGS